MTRMFRFMRCLGYQIPNFQRGPGAFFVKLLWISHIWIIEVLLYFNSETCLGAEIMESIKYTEFLPIITMVSKCVHVKLAFCFLLPITYIWTKLTNWHTIW